VDAEAAATRFMTITADAIIGTTSELNNHNYGHVKSFGPFLNHSRTEFIYKIEKNAAEISTTPRLGIFENESLRVGADADRRLRLVSAGPQQLSTFLIFICSCISTGQHAS
jgi:hypothetical protein